MPGNEVRSALPLRTAWSVSDRAWHFYAAWVVLCFVVFAKPLAALAHYALKNDNASHVLLIPFIVAWLIYMDRHRIVAGSLDLTAAACFVIPATVLSAVFFERSWADTSSGLAVAILALVLFVMAGFVAFFGRRSAKAVWSSLAFLLFFVPLPEPWLNPIIRILQMGSAAVAELFFDWTGVPALREGFVFRLPRMSIEIASECSGIRSSIALLILALLVAHFSFSKVWKKALFVMVALLMTIVKNGIRIATLTILANYVDPRFLYGRLHHQGGIVFFVIGLVLVWPVYWWLRRGESSAHSDLPRAVAS